MTYMTDDPERDADRDATVTEPVPICCECGNEIMSDEIYIVGDEVFCEDCMRAVFRVDYMEWERRYG